MLGVFIVRPIVVVVTASPPPLLVFALATPFAGSVVLPVLGMVAALPLTIATASTSTRTLTTKVGDGIVHGSFNGMPIK